MLDITNRDRTRRARHLPADALAAIEARRVTLTIPRGEDGYWTLLRYLDSRGGFSEDDTLRRLPDDEARTGMHLYLTSLVRAGIVGARKSGGPLRILKPQPEAPMLTRTGRPRAEATRQARLWIAMKMLGFFTIDDIIAAVSGGDVKAFPRGAVARYVGELAAAGYLIEREERGRKLYRFKSSMNTGPAPPQVLRARFVWDANLCRVMGQPAIEETRG